MLQVFWGLLACQILNGKGRDVVENTTLRKMRDLIDKKHAEGSIGDQEHTQLTSWLLHWLLAYSFTNKETSNTCLFATILADQHSYNNKFLSVVKMNPEGLSKYMISAFLLARTQVGQKHEISKDSLEEVAGPVALQTLQSGSDVFCSFIKTIYEDYDLDRALELVEQMGKLASEDFLLKGFAADIKKQANLLIFEMKCKLFRAVDLAEITKAMGNSVPVKDITDQLQQFMAAQGFSTTVSKTGIACSLDKSKDAELQLQKQAFELVTKT